MKSDNDFEKNNFSNTLIDLLDRAKSPIKNTSTNVSKVAELMGISKQRLSEYLDPDNSRLPSYENLRKMIIYFKNNIDDFSIDDIDELFLLHSYQAPDDFEFNATLDWQYKVIKLIEALYKYFDITLLDSFFNDVCADSIHIREIGKLRKKAEIFRPIKIRKRKNDDDDNDDLS